MNISTATSQPAASAGVAWTQDAGPGASTTPPVGTDSLSGAGAAGQQAEAAVQTAASRLQASQGYLGDIRDALDRLSTLEGSQDGAAFGEIQSQLSSLVGDGPASGSAAYDGVPLFGGSEAVVNLQGGALGGLLARGADGSFTVGASTHGVASLIEEASNQVSGASGHVDRALASVVGSESGPDSGLDGSQAALANRTAAAQIASSGAGTLDWAASSNVATALGLL